MVNRCCEVQLGNVLHEAIFPRWKNGKTDDFELKAWWGVWVMLSTNPEIQMEQLPRISQNDIIGQWPKFDSCSPSANLSLSWHHSNSDSDLPIYRNGLLLFHAHHLSPWLFQIKLKWQNLHQWKWKWRFKKFLKFDRCHECKFVIVSFQQWHRRRYDVAWNMKCLRE